jgi:hypothetical protein
LVGDATAERDFYRKLGFAISYEGPEYPDFVAMQHGDVEFGIEQRDDFDSSAPARVILWQFGVADVDVAKRVLDGAQIAYEEKLETPRPDWRYRVLRLTTPTGYTLLFEGEREQVAGLTE